jgi:hypothetical protein
LSLRRGHWKRISAVRHDDDDDDGSELMFNVLLYCIGPATVTPPEMTWSVLIQFDLLTVLSSDLSCLVFLFVYGDDCSYNNRRSIDSIGDDAIQGGPCNLVLKQKWCILMEHQCRHDGVSSTNSGFCKFKKAKKPPNQPIDTLGVATYIDTASYS